MTTFDHWYYKFIFAYHNCKGETCIWEAIKDFGDAGEKADARAVFCASYICESEDQENCALIEEAENALREYYDQSGYKDPDFNQAVEHLDKINSLPPHDVVCLSINRLYSPALSIAVYSKELIYSASEDVWKAFPDLIFEK